MYVLPLAASNGWSCSYSYVYIIFSYCHLRFYHGEDSLMYFSLHYYAAQIKLLHIHFLFISLHLHKVTLHNIMLHNCIQDRGHTEVTLLFFQESEPSTQHSPVPVSEHGALGEDRHPGSTHHPS